MGFDFEVNEFLYEFWFGFVVMFNGLERKFDVRVRWLFMFCGVDGCVNGDCCSDCDFFCDWWECLLIDDFFDFDVLMIFFVGWVLVCFFDVIDMLWFLWLLLDVVDVLMLFFLIDVEVSFGGSCNFGIVLEVVFFLNLDFLGFFFYLNGIEEWGVFWGVGFRDWGIDFKNFDDVGVIRLMLDVFSFLFYFLLFIFLGVLFVLLL